MPQLLLLQRWHIFTIFTILAGKCAGILAAGPGEVQAVQLADVGEVAADQVRQLLPLLLPGPALLRPRGPLQGQKQS